MHDAEARVPYVRCDQMSDSAAVPPRICLSTALKSTLILYFCSSDTPKPQNGVAEINVSAKKLALATISTASSPSSSHHVQ